jgi:hypothetical protein
MPTDGSSLPNQIIGKSGLIYFAGDFMNARQY